MNAKMIRMFSSTVTTNICYALLSFCFVYGYDRYFFEGTTLGIQSIFNLLLIVGIFMVFKNTFSKPTTNRLLIMGSLYSFMLTVALILGHSLFIMGNMSEVIGNLKSLIKTTITFAGFFSVILACYIWITRILSNIQTPTCKLSQKLWKHPMLLAFPMFLCWLPCYLSYYPGIMSYDMYIQSPQALGLDAITKYHPPLHTLFWKLFLLLEEYIGLNALVSYSLVQMLLLALALTYILRYLIKKQYHPYILLGTYLFFCLNPVIAIFSFVPTKDVLFSAVFAVFCVHLLQLTDNPKTTKTSGISMLVLILFGILSCLLRNNAFYALVASMIALFALTPQIRKRLLLCSAGIILGYCLINGPLYSALGFEDGDSREMLSVPIQQISYVVKNHQTELTREQLDAVNNYLPAEQLPILYNPRLADPVKITFETKNFEKDPLAFVSIWFDLFVSYPDEYVTAFLNLNLPYWYPDAATIDPYARRVYIETQIDPASVTGYNAVRESKIPFLYTFYQKVATYELFGSLPVICMLFSISTPIWLILTTAFLLINNKKYRQLAPVIPAFFLWCTYILGPVSNFRYIFPIMIMYPLYISLLLESYYNKSKN